LKVWKEVNAAKSTKRLTADEGLALLEKLKGTFTQESDLPECGICLMEMDISDCTILKSCKHVFCKICIRRVLSKSNRKCPYCRVDFAESDVVDMSAAENAANITSDTTAAEDVTKFGTPPKILAMPEAIKGLQLDEKGVIFSQFTSYLDLIGEALTKEGHSFVRIDGSVAAQK
jgi:SNF2 family DNA or RNA helicase